MREQEFIMTESKNSKSKLQSVISTIIDVVWPVKQAELKKFLPLSFMLMLIIFVYNILRAAKDAAIIPVYGVEVVSAIKLLGVLPFAILFMLFYAKLTNVLKRENVFYIILAVFLAFFAIYGFILYPLRDSVTLDLTSLKHSLPLLRYPIIMIENWSACLFYVMSELWGSMMLTLMFWQFANQITPVTEAKRFYSLFGIIGQIGMFAAGEVTQLIARSLKHSSESHASAWGLTLNWLVILTLIAGTLLGILYFWMHRVVLTDKRFYDPELINQDKGKKAKKVKLSMMESFKYIFASKYIRMIATLVLCYGVSINLVEAVWKNQANAQFPLQNDYLHFMGQFQSYTAIAVLVAMVIGSNVIRRFSWFAGAILTPLMILVTGVLFFIFILLKHNLEPTLALIGTTALMMSVILGAVQNILGKSIKYSAFDATKEMAYIPLDDELKTKGKAAVDVIGGRLGKSGGAFILQSLFAFSGLALPSLTFEIMIIFVAIMAIWISGVFSLSKAFEKETKGQK